MPVKPYPGQATFGLLPEPERSPASFITSAVINALFLAALIILGATAKRAIDEHKYEETLLILPAKPTPPPPKVKVTPPPPVQEPPKPPEIKFEAPKINIPKPEPKPEMKPLQMEAKLALPVIKEAKPAVILAPQPKAAMSPAAMPAQDNKVKFSTKPVHYGQEFGVTPNPNATRPATVAAIGNPYGGMQGPAVAPHGKVGSTGFGGGSRVGSDSGVVGKVASARVPGTTAPTYSGNQGKVASTGIAVTPAAVAPVARTVAGPPPTDLVVLSKPQPQYTSEARQLKVQGDVILRVTFAANGQVMVQGIVHGLGHGLDEEARRVAQQIRFRPATRNGQAVDMTTNITITFQLA
ncbi:MAG: TonB family protein [Terracidiphilus sp.]|jgi:TonB family protein